MVLLLIDPLFTGKLKVVYSQDKCFKHAKGEDVMISKSPTYDFRNIQTTLSEEWSELTTTRIQADVIKLPGHYCDDPTLPTGRTFFVKYALKSAL